MSGANMSVVRCEVVKGFATGCTSKRTLRGSLVVHFQVRLRCDFQLGEPFLAAGAFIQFVTSMDALVFLEMVMASEGLVTGVTMIFLKRLFGWRLTFPRLNFIQLVNMTQSQCKAKLTRKCYSDELYLSTRSVITQQLGRWFVLMMNNRINLIY